MNVGKNPLFLSSEVIAAGINKGQWRDNGAVRASSESILVQKRKRQTLFDGLLSEHSCRITPAL